jgi:hypothetical protein
LKGINLSSVLKVVHRRQGKKKENQWKTIVEIYMRVRSGEKREILEYILNSEPIVLWDEMEL